ncbi:protein cab-1 isoform X4 [Vanessa tameamea]|uniref:Protein cab-1 isoform X4 n=1 Tax=Vanessa tameamea TaxID=334116 RepID=A0A8B8ILF4_VANTA
MHTLLALVASALACAVARPPVATNAPPEGLPGPQRQRVPIPSPPEFLTAYILPRFLLPHDIGYDDSPRIPQPREESLLDREINIINQMEMQEIEPNPYDYEYPRWIPNETPPNYMINMLKKPPVSHRYPKQKPTQDLGNYPLQFIEDKPKKEDQESDSVDEKQDQPAPLLNASGLKKSFAMTPFDSGYYKKTTDLKTISPQPAVEQRKELDSVVEPRQIRQNPNLSKNKALVAGNLERLRTGFTHEYVESTDKPHHIHVLETPTTDPANSIYGIALLAAVGAALTMAIIGFAVGWYTLSRKAKAAADVDYPAYGVTGPTVDSSGDRKLAQSAHMYHYQHQKQQIIAMERNGMDHRNGSVSDPESEEENEEGDYTVYECPGFATTGDMEVKNPLFKEETTPATPAKSDTGKPQPRE